MENKESLTTSEQSNEKLKSVKNNTSAQQSFQNIEQAAIAYAKVGLSVIPTKQDKSPAINSAAIAEIKKKVATEDQIKKWYSKSASSVGILCGAISQNVECLDLDEKYNVDPTSLFEQLYSLVESQVPGLIVRLVHETSINGGHHLIYKCRSIDRSQILARREATTRESTEDPKCKSKTLIETRGEGGYFACYPTLGYSLVSGSLTNIPEISETERNILLSCALGLNRVNSKEKVVTGYSKDRMPSVERPGDDFNIRGDIELTLKKAGWTKAYSKSEMQYWRRPGKNIGVSASFNTRTNMFYVFSTNADPLEPNTWYSKFALLAELEHDGNFQTAAVDLAEKKFGVSTISKTESFLNTYYDFRYNVITGRVEFRSKGATTFDILQDYDLNSISRKLEYSHINVSPSYLAEILKSNYSTQYDPFKEYYESLTVWDKQTDYMAQLADTVTLKDVTEKDTFKEYLQKWLVAAVGCAINPDVINHTCLTLVGPQGRYKTTWLNKLVPVSLSDYTYVGTIDPSNKDTLIQMSECFMINLDELETLNKHELGTLKTIMTSKASRVRRPYGHFADQLVRRASFAGSINRNNFLTDETGTRRFLVFEIDSIDPKHTVDIDKVHAQAYHLFKSGYRYWFDQNEVTTVNTRNKKFIVQTTEDELVAQYCESGALSDWQTATEVAEQIKGRAGYAMTKYSARDFGYALKKAEFKSKILNGTTRYNVIVSHGLSFRLSGLNSSPSGVEGGVEGGVTDSAFA